MKSLEIRSSADQISIITFVYIVFLFKEIGKIDIESIELLQSFFSV